MASPTEMDALKATALQQLISGVRRGQQGRPSTPWPGLMAGSTQAGCGKLGRTGKHVSIAEGAPPPDPATQQ